MSPDFIQYLLNVVGSTITKKDTKFRKVISQQLNVYAIELEDQLHQP